MAVRYVEVTSEFGLADPKLLSLYHLTPMWCYTFTWEEFPGGELPGQVNAGPTLF